MTQKSISIQFERLREKIDKVETNVCDIATTISQVKDEIVLIKNEVIQIMSNEDKQNPLSDLPNSIDPFNINTHTTVCNVVEPKQKPKLNVNLKSSSFTIEENVKKTKRPVKNLRQALTSNTSKSTQECLLVSSSVDTKKNKTRKGSTIEVYRLFNKHIVQYLSNRSEKSLENEINKIFVTREELKTIIIKQCSVDCNLFIKTKDSESKNMSLNILLNESITKLYFVSQNIDKETNQENLENNDNTDNHVLEKVLSGTEFELFVNRVWSLGESI